MQSNNQQTIQYPIQPVDAGGPASPAGGLDKEKEVGKRVEAPLEEIAEAEPSAEVAKHLLKIRDEVDLPPDLKKMGVSTPTFAGSVSDTAMTSLALPLTDDQIVVGVHAQILSSLRWLAEWCLRQLKKAHIHLQKIHGRFVRVKD